MSLQSSKIQRKKVEGGDEDDDANNNDLKLVFDFLKEAKDDILLEIFVRLPNCRSAILFGSVCRYWHSLISGPQFLSRFISHHREHQERYSLPYTIIFRSAAYEYYQPICKLFSKESLFIHRNTATNASFLDFLPCPMVIRASCNDLLLVCPVDCEYLGSEWWSKLHDFYICNPITKQFYRLPQFDRPSGYYRITGHALVYMPHTILGSPANDFKVIEFYDLRDEDLEVTNSEAQPFSYMVSLFCSKSRKWGRECFQCPRPNGLSPYSYAREMEEVVTCNGIAYWLENYGDVDRVIALDLLNMECGVIVFPCDIWWFRQPEDDQVPSVLWRYRRYGDCHVREQIGAVCGELRLIQVVLTGPRLIPNLKIWKYNDNKEWVLIYDKKNLKRPSSNDDNDDDQQFSAVFVHPTNGNMIFLVWNKNIFQYNLNSMEEDVYKMMGEIEESLDTVYRLVQAHQYGWIKGRVSVPMVHPPWPTPLPRSV